jgi:hypothetical protein
VASYAVDVVSAGDPNGFAATIWLSDQAGATVAFVRFYAEGTTMAPNEYRADLGYPSVSFSFGAFAATVDLLRHEDPVYFTWFDYAPVRQFGSIGTSREPAGEEETDGVSP